MSLIPSVVESIFFFFDIDSLFPQSFLSILLGVVRVDPTIIPWVIKGRKKNMPPRDSNEEKPLSKKKPPLNWSLFMYNVIAIEYYFFLVVLPSIVSVCFLALFSYNTFLSFFFFCLENVYAKMANFLFQKTTHNTVFWFW